MSFPLLICSNCDKDTIDDSFLLLGLKNEKELNKKNPEEVSYSDNNNNSTNNFLEIIDYPYSLNNNQIDSNVENDISEQIYFPIKTEEKKIKRKYDDLDDDLLDIKPPKLFSKVNKDKVEEKKEVEQVIKTEPEVPKEKKLIIEANTHIINEQNTDIKMYSNKSESLINNDNSIMNNKLLLTNYKKNSSNNNEKKENVEKIENNKNEIITRNLTDINNNINDNKIIGLKVDYPCPDTDSLYFKSNRKSSLNTKDNKNIKESKNKKNEKDKDKENEIKGEEKKLFSKKIKKFQKEKDNNSKKIIEYDIKKPKNKALSNYNVSIDKIKANFDKNKIKNNNIKNQMIKNKKKLTFNSLSNFSNRFNLKQKKISDDVSAFFNQTENYKFQKSNNILLQSIINKKINARNKNIFKSYFESNKKTNKSHYSRAFNQTTIFNTKTYTNPFLKVFDYKKK